MNKGKNSGGATVSTEKKVGIDLTEGSILKKLLIFAIPIILTNIIQQLYSMVDLMVIGQYAGSSGTVGVSSGGEIADIMTPIAIAFSNAGQIYVAQLFGARMEEKVKKGVGTLISLMLGMSVLFMILTMVFCLPILHLLNCPVEALEPARQYMLITAVGIPFIFGYNAVCGILRGLGESRRPMLFIMIAAVINIVLDLLLVAGAGMGAAGTAIATVLAQVGAFAASFYFLCLHKEQFAFELRLSSLRLDKDAVRIILVQGFPQAVRSMFVRFSLLWVNAQINSYGLTASAANSVGNKMQKFLDVFTIGITHAAGAMVGQNLGAKKQKRAADTVWATLGSSLCSAAVLTVLSLTIPRQLFGIFTSDPAVLDMGEIYMRITFWHFIWSAVTGSLQAIVIGSGYASMNFMIGILDGVVCKIGLSILFAQVLGMGLNGYFHAIAWSRFIPGIICLIFFLSGRWKQRKLLSEDN